MRAAVLLLAAAAAAADRCSYQQQLLYASGAWDDSACPVDGCGAAACLAGFETAGGTKSTCPGGSYCPVGFTCSLPCSTGAYCPALGNGTAAVTAGASSDAMCDAGHFCATPLERQLCPEGHWCGQGFSEAVPCPALTECAEGTDKPMPLWSGLLVLVAIVALPAVVAHAFNRFSTGRVVEECAAAPGPGEGEGEADGVMGPLLQAAERFQCKLCRHLQGLKDMKQPLLQPLGAVEQRRASRDAERGALLSALDGLEPKAFRLRLTVRRLRVRLLSWFGGGGGGGDELQLLDCVDADFLPGRITAVMGPSGSGKSTLVRVLSDRQPNCAVEGELLFNGRPGRARDFAPVVGFVPQSDATVSDRLTVEETLAFYARLRLPVTLAPRKRAQIVSDVIHVLGLNRVRRATAGGLSGGEVRRTNIAMELVGDPSLLFLDEPTSGLDASAALDVGAALRDIASLGVTVVAVVHQPREELLGLCDDLVLLLPRGRVGYSGPVDAALDHMAARGFPTPARTNPADFLVDVASGRLPHPTEADWEPGALVGSSPSSPSSAPPVAPPDEEYAPRDLPNLFVAVWIQVRRSLVLQMREPLTYVMDLALVALAGLALGVVFRSSGLDDVVTEFLMVTLVVGMAAIQSALRLFADDRVLAWRERDMGLSLTAAFAGKGLSHALPVLALPAAFLSTFYPLTVPRASLSECYVILGGVTLACSGIGREISVTVPRASQQVAGVVVALLSCFVAGANPTAAALDDMGWFMWLVSRLSFARWGVEALVAKEVARWPPIWQPEVDSLVAHYGYSTTDYTLDIAALLAIGVLTRAFAMCAYTSIVPDRKQTLRNLWNHTLLWLALVLLAALILFIAVAIVGGAVFLLS